MRNKTHIVFGLSAAASLRKALTMVGRDELVLSPEDDFSFGPLSPGDATSRARWVHDVLGYVEWTGLSAATLAAMEAEGDAEIIAWVSPDSASSVGGYLWWLSRTGHSAIRVNRIDRLGLLQPTELTGYLDGHVELRAEEHDEARGRWHTLVAENAPFRVLSNAGLVSAALDHFDAQLLAHTGAQWRKMARVIGETLMASYEEDGFFQTGDLVLAFRLRALARNGAIEWQGQLNDMRYCELRLPDGG